MTQHRKVRIGIWGTGGYGATGRAYLRHTGLFDIVACLDVNEGAAVAGAGEEGATAYTDADAFLAHEGMEAVSINTPVMLHAEHIERSLDAGKHVLVTKPVAESAKQAIPLMDKARSAGLAFMVGHHARHDPCHRFIRDLLKEGRIGRICNVSATCCSSGGLEQKPGDWRTDPERNPGGPLLQCGIHMLDYLLGVFGPVDTVYSTGQFDVTETGVVDNTSTILAFECGVQVAFVCNYTTAYMHTLDIFGTAGNIHLCEHIRDLGVKEVYFQPRHRGEHEPWQELEVPHDPGYPDGHGGVIEKSFADQIHTGKPDYGNLRDGIAALRVVEAAAQSQKTGQPMKLSEGEGSIVSY